MRSGREISLQLNTSRSRTIRSDAKKAAPPRRRQSGAVSRAVVWAVRARVGRDVHILGRLGVVGDVAARRADGAVVRRGVGLFLIAAGGLNASCIVVRWHAERAGTIGSDAVVLVAESAKADVGLF